MTPFTLSVSRSVLVLALCGCGNVSSDPGLSASLQIRGLSLAAQFNPGPMPGDGTGPKVIAMNVSAFNVQPGAIEQPLLGTLDASATAVAFQLDGDTGWWLLPAGVPDTDTPTMPSFEARMSFARTLPPGPARLVGRAIDGAGNFGPAAVLNLTVQAAPAPSGRLIVTLSWSSLTDLDLHVVDPDGSELWSGSPSVPSGGLLDLDSNSQCVIDGVDQEIAHWDTPPPGHYVVRVDAFSLCGQPVAGWRVEALLDGVSLGAATGQAVDADTIGPHQRGSGREALDFDVPAP
jgi:hypothetical protein